MYAVEFQTMITDGKIEIPIEYKAKLINSVRVIVLMEEKNIIPVVLSNNYYQIH